MNEDKAQQEEKKRLQCQHLVSLKWKKQLQIDPNRP